MRKFFLLVSLIVGFQNVLISQINKDLPFAMPAFQKPVFKTDTFSIVKYGAIPDGLTKNTVSFSKAIEACAKNGGGVVLVPAGLWLTGPIVLKSNVNLHLAKGSLVLFSRDFNDYPMIMSYWEGNRTWRCQSPVSGFDLENIAITGPGIMDGSGDVWRFVKKSKLTANQWKELVASGGVLNAAKTNWYPSESSLKGNMMADSKTLPPVSDSLAYAAIKDYMRPVMVSLVNCKKVLLDGPTFQNSPSWCVHPLMCEQLFVYNVNIRNPWYAQNGDGLDIESCNIGEVYNCTFDVGDDAICIKSGRDEEGRKRGKPTENFIISDCVVYHGHGGFVIGSEMSGGVRNLFVNNCTFLGTDIGLRFKTARNRGGVVENIYISNINMINIPTDAIRFDMYYMGLAPIVDDNEEVKPDDPGQKFVVNEGTPQFRNFYINNVSCNGAAQAIHLQGLPEMSIKNIVIENSSFKAKRGFTCIDGENIKLNNVTLDISADYAATIVNSKNVDISAFEAFNYKNKLLKVSGERSSGIIINKKTGKLNNSEIETTSNVKTKVTIK